MLTTLLAAGCANLPFLKQQEADSKAPITNEGVGVARVLGGESGRKKGGDAVDPASVPYEEQEVPLALNAFKKLVRETPVITEGAQARQVATAARSLAVVTDRTELPWEYVLLDNPDVSEAVVLPGGKVVVYSGLLSQIQSNEELAAALGHLFGHWLAGHGRSRLLNLFAVHFNSVEEGWQDASDPTLNLLLQAYGLTVGGLEPLPFNVREETEADAIAYSMLLKGDIRPEAVERHVLTLPQKLRQFGLAKTHPFTQYRADKVRSVQPVPIPK